MPASTANQLIFEQPDASPPEHAPPDYRPAYDPDLVYEDALHELAPPFWHPYFNGGSNMPVWVRVGAHGDELHFIEDHGFELPYRAYSENYAVEFANAYDTFYYADQQAD